MSDVNGLIPPQVSADKVYHGVACSHVENNGVSDLVTALGSQTAAHEFLQQPPIKATDEHLVEFADAMRTVAKALRRVAEGKAAAQQEAAEWKHKYELERAHNLRLNHTVPVAEVCHSIPDNEKSENRLDQSMVQNSAIEKSDKCCGKHGICSHEILRNEVTDLGAHKLFAKKASFKLRWGCNGEKSGQHKHDIVSFERGNITTAERSSKQILLKWESRPQTVLILTKPNSKSVRALCAEMVRWLREQRNIDVVVEPRVKIELVTETYGFNFVRTWEDDAEIKLLHTKVDLVITLGGDGTVLWAASMFKGPVPPVVSFSLGSLGFMTPFQSEHYRDYLDAIFRGPISITLRHRLQCHIIREADKNELQTEDPILVLNEAFSLLDISGSHGERRDRQLHRHHLGHHPPSPRRLPQVRLRGRILDMSRIDALRVFAWNHLCCLCHHQVRREEETIFYEIYHSFQGAMS